MKNQYDVVIVGAGPSGLQCARDIVDLGKLSVLVIEKSQIVGEPNFSTGGIPYYTKTDFNVPPATIVDSFTKISFISQNEKAVFEGTFEGGYVTDFRKLKAEFCNEIQRKGGEILFGTEVIDIIMSGKEVKGVRLKTSEKEEPTIYCKFLVDATARNTSLSEKMGLKKNVRGKPTVGEEYIIKVSADSFFKNNLTIFVGKKYFSNGYGWVFPFGEGVYKVGVIRYDMPHKLSANIDASLHQFLHATVGETYEILEKHGGTLFLNGSSTQATVCNFAMIGDSINMCNPMFAEGIRHGLQSGRFCANTINQACETGVKDLGAFEQIISRYKGSRWKVSRLFATLLYHTPSDRARDVLAKLVRKWSYEEMIEVGFGYKYSLLLKLLG